ncbi:hypothetical protein [Vogesella indigofera]|uniref:Uncharacterized protein n=1 Tax=Vogesella indigofera TaxID=45465 RepID=A0ABT5I609_VOGIN|nr:hypothetical protein [Vogesella indigofera]MDC7691330.1 hypothetical protein [Vogesella indigofera]
MVVIVGLSSEGVRFSGGYPGPVLVAVSNGPAGGIIDAVDFQKTIQKIPYIVF